MKKVLGLILLVVLCFTLMACGETYTRIGTSKLSIVIPDGYVLTSDDLAEDQIAYYSKDDNSIDFDLYQWAKDGIYTLEGEANAFAAYYNTTAEEVTINGIKGYKYVSAEEYEGNTYTVVNYMFEDDDSIVEISFWTVGESEYDAVNSIINTLKMD